MMRTTKSMVSKRTAMASKRTAMASKRTAAYALRGVGDEGRGERGGREEGGVCMRKVSSIPNSFTAFGSESLSMKLKESRCGRDAFCNGYGCKNI